MTGRWRSWTPQLLSILRIVAAFLFMAHGMSKLFAFPVPMMPGASGVPWLSQIGVAGMIEAFGGGLLLLGIFTRCVAFVAAGEMAFAYFLGHASGGFWPLVNHGEPAVLFCFTWLYISAAGPGPWSIDAMMSRKSAQ